MEYIIRDYNPEDEDSVLELIQLGMGGGPTGTREKSFWRWKHFDNPFGQSISLVASTDTGQLIGLRTFMRWRFQAGDTNVNAVRAVDTVTHPEYRRYRVFSRLTTKAVERVRKDGVDFIFNTPNQQVLPGYLKLGWNYVSFVQPLIQILNYPRFVTGLLLNRKKYRASGQISPEQIFKHELPTIAEFLSRSKGIEQLLDTNSHMRSRHICTNQSLDYLWWRYSGHPFTDYRVIYHEKNGILSGCVILRPSTRFGLKEVVVNELLLSGSDESVASSLLNELKRCISADYIIAYFPKNSLQRYNLRKNGFHQIPKNGQNFTVNIFNTNLPCDPLLFENWDLSLGDLEVF